MNYRDLLALAIRIAANAHGDDLNKDGTPYILHPLRLMMQADSYEAKIVAVLHDTIEDTALTLYDLHVAGFDDTIVSAVDALTKRDDEPYEDAIGRVAADRLATTVKLLDLQHNIDVTRLPELGESELQRTARYHRAIQRLKAVQSAWQQG
jgi:(p)ppGpp synthase/HD superfamily hydrolase